MIRNETELLVEIRLGFATDRITPELKDFLTFLSSKRGRAAVRAARFTEPVVPRDQPVPVTTVPHKPTTPARVLLPR